MADDIVAPEKLLWLKHNVLALLRGHHKAIKSKTWVELNLSISGVKILRIYYSKKYEYL